MRPAGKDEIDIGLVHGILQPDMQCRSLRPKLQHVAQHRDAPRKFLPRHSPERSERRAHRRRIGVVALIDQKRFSAADLQQASGAASARRLEFGKRRQRRLEIGADRDERRDDGQRILGDVPSGHGETDAMPFASRSTTVMIAAVIREPQIFAANVGRPRRSRSHRLGAKPLRERFEPRRVRIVVLDDRRTARTSVLRRSRPWHRRSPRRTGNARDARPRRS